jgi:quinol monooxygenase YgiN
MRQILQHNIELLVVTLAHTRPGKEVDALARIGAITDTLRQAPGLITSHFYYGENNENTFLILTTWEDPESWYKAQERYNPRQLLLNLKDLLTAPPEQCLMSYSWGYSRPTRSPILTTAHLITLPTSRVDQALSRWLQALQQTNLQMLLTFAFLAQGQREQLSIGLDTTGQTAIPGPTAEATKPTSAILLGLFSWASEIERDEFYIQPHYQSAHAVLESVGHALILPLRSF